MFAHVFVKLGEEVSGLNTTCEKLQTELTRLHMACQSDRFTLELASMKTDISRIQMDIDTARAPPSNNAPPLWPLLQASRNGTVTPEEAVLAAMHTELSDKQRRACNVIVRGLQPVDGVHDADLFTSLCEVNLPVKPCIKRTRCRRIEKQYPGKIQPLLIVTFNEAAAAELLRCAPLLRRSADEIIKRSVYISPDRIHLLNNCKHTMNVFDGGGGETSIQPPILLRSVKHVCQHQQMMNKLSDSSIMYLIFCYLMPLVWLRIMLYSICSVISPVITLT